MTEIKWIGQYITIKKDFYDTVMIDYDKNNPLLSFTGQGEELKI